MPSSVSKYMWTISTCQKVCVDNSKLDRHKLVHTGERSHTCGICDKKFTLDWNLKTHLRTHTGEKPYQCKYPGWSKRFTQSSNLSAHEKIHRIRDVVEKTPNTPNGKEETNYFNGSNKSISYYIQKNQSAFDYEYYCCLKCRLRTYRLASFMLHINKNHTKEKEWL